MYMEDETGTIGQPNEQVQDYPVPKIGIWGYSITYLLKLIKDPNMPTLLNIELEKEKRKNQDRRFIILTEEISRYIYTHFTIAIVEYDLKTEYKSSLKVTIKKINNEEYND